MALFPPQIPNYLVILSITILQHNTGWFYLVYNKDLEDEPV